MLGRVKITPPLAPGLEIFRDAADADATQAIGHLIEVLHGLLERKDFEVCVKRLWECNSAQLYALDREKAYNVRTRSPCVRFVRGCCVRHELVSGDTEYMRVVPGVVAMRVDDDGSRSSMCEAAIENVLRWSLRRPQHLAIFLDEALCVC